MSNDDHAVHYIVRIWNASDLLCLQNQRDDAEEDDIRDIVDYLNKDPLGIVRLHIVLR